MNLESLKTNKKMQENYTSESTYQKLLAKRQKRDELKAQYETACNEVKELETVLIQLIKWKVSIKWAWIYITTRTNIKWKEVLTKHIGKKKVDKISADTPATEYEHLGIDNYDKRETITTEEKGEPNCKVKKIKLKRC
jgi:hypothetical protein